MHAALICARLTRCTQAELRAWEARLRVREAALDARDGAAPSELEAPSGSSRLAGILAHAGDWTVRNGALFVRAVRQGEWTVRGGSSYAKVAAMECLLDSVEAPASPAHAAQAQQGGSAPKAPPALLGKLRGAGVGPWKPGSVREWQACAFVV